MSLGIGRVVGSLITPPPRTSGPAASPPSATEPTPAPPAAVQPVTAPARADESTNTPITYAPTTPVVVDAQPEVATPPEAAAAPEVATPPQEPEPEPAPTSPAPASKSQPDYAPAESADYAPASTASASSQPSPSLLALYREAIAAEPTTSTPLIDTDLAPVVAAEPLAEQRSAAGIIAEAAYALVARANVRPDVLSLVKTG